MRPRPFAVIICLLLTVPLGAMQETGRSLESGDVSHRLDALVEIVATPPANRSPSVLAAVRREAERMLRDYYRSKKPIRDEDIRELNSSYAAGLVRVLGESGDPLNVPILIEYAGFGRYAVDGLGKLGDAAVPAMLLAARRDRNDLNQRDGVILALSLMLKPQTSSPLPALNDESKRRIAELGAELVEHGFTYGNVVAVSALVIATGEPELRKKLERLGTDATLWHARGLRNDALIRQAQDQIKLQLSRSTQP